MFGIIIGILVLFVIGGLFSRPRYYHRSPMYRPYGGFGGWGMGMGRPYGPMMHHGPMHHHHGPHGGPHGHMGHGPMGHGRRW